jgi:5-methyltetrahydropteroyltriglutamate--homocysteine methyltransferase
MIQAFTGKLPGIRGHDVIGKVQAAPTAIAAADTKYASSRAPKVKGIITGPSSLAHGLHISPPMYRDKEDLARDLAVALVPEAKALQAAGAALLQIDEPIFSTGVADLATGKETVDLIAQAVTIPVCMHVCGNLGNVIDELLKFNVAVFDFEFANNPGNIDLLSRRDLNGKMIGYGCVDSTTDKVESVSDIRKRIERGVGIFGEKNMLIDPDCGLRMRTREAAFAKLKNMAEAAKEVRLAL